MKLSTAVKPISYFKRHAAESLRDIKENQGIMVITQHGEARAVLQDIVSYEQTQESLAMLKVLAQSTNSLEAGRVKPVAEAFAGIRSRIRERSE